MRIVLLGNCFDSSADVVSKLISFGCDAICVKNAAGLYLELLKRSTDTVIIDLDNVDEDFVTVSRYLRALESTSDLGIIMLGTNNDMEFRVHLLKGGADVYLVKPVNIEELFAYLSNLMRRRHPKESRTGAICWKFVRAEWRLMAPSGVAIDLSHLENAFVEIIAKNAGKPVRRRDIIVSAFGKDPLSYDNRRLEAVVSRLKRKVQRAYPFSQPIKVVHSIGYVFTELIVCT
jgi:DNA-binding response OmpR family regulator